MDTERKNTERRVESVVDLETFLENSRILYEEMGELSTVFANVDLNTVNHEGIFTGLIERDDGRLVDKSGDNSGAILDDDNFERVIDEYLKVGDTTGLYLTEMGKIPLLTQDQEVFLAKRIEIGREAAVIIERGKENSNTSQNRELDELIANGKEARDYLIKANIRLVVSVAKKYNPGSVHFLDLIQEGNLGLIRAVEKYDYRKGTKFSTYSTWWIRQKITRAIADQSRTIRLPVYIHNRLNKLHNNLGRLKQELGRTPRPEEIAGRMDLELDEVIWLMGAELKPMSLDKLLHDDKETELIELTQDTSSPSPPEIVEQKMLRERISSALASLSRQDALIISLRYGLLDGSKHSRRVIGERVGLSGEMVRLREIASLKYLEQHSR